MSAVVVDGSSYQVRPHLHLLLDSDESRQSRIRQDAAWLTFALAICSRYFSD